MSTWSGASVLVTGAGGFIGSHLVERLSEEGAQVRAFVHYNALGSAGWLGLAPQRSRVEIVAGDITDPESVRLAVRGRDVVFHLAALIGIPYSYDAPRSYVRVNVEGTLNVLSASRESGVRRIVHTSTSETYGSARQVPMSESHPLQGQSPYAASKIGADKMAEAYHLSFGLPVVTVRPFNTYGPRQSQRAVIPTIIAQALQGEIVRLGSIYPTRDFNYVADTVDAFVRAGSAANVEGRTFNVGGGKDVSIGELVERVGRVLGKTLRVESQERRVRPEASEVDRLCADATLARSLLGWSPKVDLDEGLRRTVVWMREQGGRPDGYRI